MFFFFPNLSKEGYNGEITLIFRSAALPSDLFTLIKEFRRYYEKVANPRYTKQFIKCFVYIYLKFYLKINIYKNLIKYISDGTATYLLVYYFVIYLQSTYNTSSRYFCQCYANTDIFT